MSSNCHRFRTILCCHWVCERRALGFHSPYTLAIGKHIVAAIVFMLKRGPGLYSHRIVHTITLSLLLDLWWMESLGSFVTVLSLSSLLTLLLSLYVQGDGNFITVVFSLLSNLLSPSLGMCGMGRLSLYCHKCYTWNAWNDIVAALPLS